MGLCLALIHGNLLYGQAGDYTFSSSTAPFTPITAGTDVNSIEADAAISAVIPLGFTFDFEGTSYTSVRAGSDGFLSFNASAGSGTTNDLDNGTASRRPLVAPLWDDHAGSVATSSSKASYVVTGTAPNRVFTFEWLNWEWNYGANDSTVSFQVKLYETTNEIEFTYRWENYSALNSPSASIGLSGVSTFLSVSGIGTGTPVVSNTTETATIDTIVTDQVFTFTPPACVSPIFTSPTNITTASATVNFTGGAGSYEINWDVAGFTQGAPSSNTGLSASNSFTATGLSGSTSYDFYVRKDCGGSVYSSWTGPFTVSTPYLAPYTEDWSNSYPNDWTEGKGLITDSTTFTSSSSAWASGSFTGSGSASAKLNLYGTGIRDWVISPSIDLGTGNGYEVAFDLGLTTYNSSSASTLGIDDTIKLVISLDNGITWSDTNTLLTLHSGSVIPNGAGGVFSASLVGYSGVVKFGLYAESSLTNADNDVYMDNFVVRTPLACPKPTALADSNITTSSIDIGWQSGGSGPWYIYWGPCNFNQATPGVTIDTATTNTYTLSGLTPGTSYEYYLFERCGTDLSDTIAGGCFTTICLAQNLPYSENFDQNLGCFSVLDSGNSADTWMQVGDYNSQDLDGTGFAFVNSDAAGFSASLDEYLVSPVINATGLTGALVLDFDQYFNELGDNADVDVWDGTQWVTVLAQSGSVVGSFTAPDHQSIDITAYANANLQVRFHYYNANWTYYWAVDNFEVKEVNCFSSSALQAYYLSSDSLGMNWIPGDGLNYGIEYGPAGFALGTGSFVSTVDTFMTVGGLTPNSSYDFYLTDTCLAGNSSTVGPITVKTFCSPTMAPYIETFDGSTWMIGSSGGVSDTIDDCWYRNSNTGYKWSVYNGTTSSGNTGPDQDHTSGTGNFIYVESSSTTPSVAEFVSPLIDVSALNTPYVAFWYHRFGSVATMGDMTVDVNDGKGWVTLMTITGTQHSSGTDPFLEKGIDVSSFGDTIQVRFTATSKGCCAGDMAIDDFEVREAPSCPDLVALNVSGASDTSAVLGWANSNSAISYQVWYGPQGFYQGTQTSGGSKAFSTTNSYTVDTLTASNCYDFLVRGICGPGDTTAWAGPVSFNTTAGALTVPVYEDFENGLVVLRNNCNNMSFWQTQQVIVNSGTSAGKVTYQASDNSSLELAGLLDLTSVVNPTLSFWHIAKLEGGFDDAYVEVSTDGGASYTALPASAYLGAAGSYATDLLFDEDDYPIWGTTTVAAQNTWWQKEVFSLNGYQTDSVMIRFRITSDGSIQRDGWYIDDMSIVSVTCQQPTSLGIVSNTISYDTAQVYWTSGGASNFNIQFDTVGFPLGMGRMVNSINDTAVLSNLLPETCYEYYVRDSCAVGDVSAWSGPFSFCTTPTCPAPSAAGVDLSSITVSTADIYWTSGGSSNFNVEYGPVGFTVGTGTLLNVANDSTTLTGLTAASCYDVYVRDSCGVGDVSVWVGPFSLCTSCLPYAAPYYQDFNGQGWVADDADFSASNSVIGVCWTRNPDNSSAYSWRVRSTATGSGSTGPNTGFGGSGNYTYAESSSGSTGNTAELVSPEVSLAGTSAPILSYAYHFYGANINKMYIDIHNGTSWVTAVDSIVGAQQTSSSDPWVLDTIALSTYGTATVKVRFRAISGGCCSGDLAIDEFYVGDPATCLKPTALGVSSPTATSVSANWTTGGATAWNIEYGPVGFVLGTGTHITNVNTNPFTITGLTAGTCYEYYVRDSCGTNSVSLWGGPKKFTTPAGALTFPVVEDFENGFTTFDNNCNNKTLWGIQQSIVNGGSNAAKLTYQDSDTSVLELRGTVDLTNTTAPVLTFAHIAALEGGFDEGHVQISTDGGLTYTDLPASAYIGSALGYTSNLYFEEDDYTIWGTILAPAQNTWWQREMFDLSAYKTTNVRVRFQIDSDGSIQRDGWYIDDIEIVEMPCLSPTNVTAVVQGCDTVDVSWSSAAATTSSYVEYGAKGFTLGSGTVVPNVSSPYQITGLSLNTEYDVYVVDSCSMDVSSPSSVATFKTDSVGPVLASFVWTQSDTTLVDATVDFDAAASTGDGLSYSWDFGNSNTGTGVNSSATYTMNQSYSVKLTVTDRCGNTDDTTIAVAVTNISISENVFNAGIGVYPNPSNGNFKVKITGATATYNVEVTDLSGKVVYRISDLEPGVEQNINLGNVAEGVYIVRFSGKGLNASQRIMVD